jgi:putative endonuclease
LPAGHALALQQRFFVKVKYIMNEQTQFCVYILTNKSNTVLYTGVTNNLYRRVMEHKEGKGSGFTKKYNLSKLVFFECGDKVETAIVREKQIKAGSRKDKLDLVNSMNPEWKDLFNELFE